MPRKDDFRQLLMLKKEHAQVHETEKSVPPRNNERRGQTPVPPRHFPHKAIGNR